MTEIAKRHGKTVAQVILRRNIQRGVIVIPQTFRKSRMKENFNVWNFAPDAGDMAAIARLNTGSTFARRIGTALSLRKFIFRRNVKLFPRVRPADALSGNASDLERSRRAISGFWTKEQRVISFHSKSFLLNRPSQEQDGVL